jgi:2-iminoacetate synthase ThiH
MLKTLAIARIYLDNFDHIKAYWVLMGLKLAQVSLSHGVDDMDGTVIEEKIYHMAGAKTPQEMACAELVKAIREAGREPVQRDSLYHPVNPDAVGRGGPTAPLADALGGLEPARPAEASYVGASNEGGAA